MTRTASECLRSHRFIPLSTYNIKMSCDSLLIIPQKIEIMKNLHVCFAEKIINHLLANFSQRNIIAECKLFYFSLSDNSLKVN